MATALVRAVPGIGYLRRDQLIYELKIRGMSADGSVPELAARLRTATQVPVTLSPTLFSEHGEFLDQISKAVDELSQNVVFLESAQPTSRQISRVQAQLAHYCNALSDIALMELSPQHVTWREQLYQSVRSLQDRLLALSLGGGGSTELENIQSEGNATSSVSAPPLERFAPLPNPLTALLKDVTDLSLDDLERSRQVLWLLVRLQIHADVLKVPHSVLLSLLYPLARGTLSFAFSEVMQEQGSLRELRRKILTQKLSARMRRQLEDRYWQAQGEQEPLEQYCDRVRTAVQALDMQISESDTIRHLFEGMRPQDRCRFICISPPRTLQELADSVGALAFADQQRSSVRASPGGDKSGDVQRPEIGEQKISRRCFRCGSSEHMVRQCPVPKPARPNS